MKFIFTHKQFESLGVSSEVEKIAQQVQRELLASERSYLYKGEMIGRQVSIEFKLQTDFESYKGYILHSYMQFLGATEKEAGFFVSLGDPELPTIVHELKHIHRVLARGLMADETYYLDHVGRDIIENVEEWGSLPQREGLSDILYMATPDEFEATYNEWVQQIRSMNSPGREEILDFLEGQDLFVLYKEIIQSGFSMRDWFKGEKEMLLFVQYFLIKKSEFLEESPEYEEVWNPPQEISTPTRILKTQVKKIEFLISSNCKKNYRKTMRLFSA
jgi:hypothetical protein